MWNGNKCKDYDLNCKNKKCGGKKKIFKGNDGLSAVREIEGYTPLFSLMSSRMRGRK